MKVGHSFLSSAAVVSLLMAGTLPASVSYAQKGVVLAPATEWSIQKVEARTGADGYCALAKRFERNTVLTFAKNQKQEMSFALDFQKPVFDPADSFEVVLDPGAAEQRAYQIRPVSTKAFVIRLGKDRGFLSALEKTGFLRVEFGPRSYGFDLSDIDAGQFRLNSCVSDMRVVSSDTDTAEDIDSVGAVPVSRPKPSVVAQDRAQTSSGIVELSERIQSLEQENAGLRVELAQLESSQFSQVGDGESRSRLLALQAENERLRSALAGSGGDTPELDMLRRELATVREENRALTRIIENAGAGDEAAQANDLVAALKAENKSLREQLDSVGGATGSAALLQAKLDVMQDENRRLQRELKLAQGGASGAQEISQQLASLGAENTRLKAQLQQQRRYEAEIEDLHNQIRDLKLIQITNAGDPDMARQQFDNKLVEQIRKLREENETLNNALSQKNSVSETLVSLRKQVQSLRDENNMLRSDKQQVRMALQSERTEIGRLSAAQKEQELKAKRLAVLEAENRSLEETASKLRAQLDEERGQVGELRAESKAYKLRAEQLAGLEQQIELLRNTADQLRIELAEERSEIGKLAAENKEKDIRLEQLSTLRRQLAALRAENLELETRTRQAAQDSLKLEALQDQVTFLEQDKKRLQAQLNAARDLTAKENNQLLSFYEEENQKLKDQLVQLHSRVAQADDAEAELVKLKAENEALISRLASRQSLSPDQGGSSRVQELIEENRRLKNDLALRDGQNSELAALRKENERLAQALKDRPSEGQTSRVLLTELTRLEQDNERLERELEIVRLELSETAGTALAGYDPMSAALDEIAVLADGPKAEAMQNLAREYMKLKQRVSELERGSLPGAPVAAMRSELNEPAPTLLSEDINPSGAANAPARTMSSDVESVAMRQEMLPVPVTPVVQNDVGREASETDRGSREQPLAEQVRPVNAGPAGNDRQAEPDRQVETDSFNTAQAQERRLIDQIQAQLDTMGGKVTGLGDGEIDPPGLRHEKINGPRDHTGGGQDTSRQEELPVEDSVLVNEEGLQAEIAPQPLETQDLAPPPAVQEVPQEIARAPAIAPISEEIPQPQAVQETQEVPAVESAAVADVTAPRAFSSAESAPAFTPSFKVKDVIANANIIEPAQIREVQETPPDILVYQWQAGEVYGSAEQKPLSDPEEFEDNVRSYLELTETRCAGDYAVMPDNTMQRNGMRIDTYEVACVGSEINSSASLVFFSTEGSFVTVAHEVETEKMAKAMDIRDRLLRTISGS